MNKLYLVIFILLLQTTLQAQDIEHRTCGSTEYMQQLELADPSIVTQRQLIETQIAQYLQQPHKKSRTVITIPVVVHVVYNLGPQNISDAQIASQIAVLNKDFRKLNIDFANTPGAFQPMAADCQIEFVLAKRDPNGDSTTGITRTYTTTTSFSANNNVKNSLTGGKSAWPSGEYLNIWVCRLSGGLLGYGQFPGGPAATDGVVISYKAFGTTGAALAPFNKGRTTTHEIGHWLNLFHIWGDDGGNCNGTDLVEDTPNQGAQNTGVPTYPRISCNNTPFGDMFMNYMDYTDDIAMTMFTMGQKSRIDAMFIPGGARFSLLSSQGGNAPTPQISCGIPTNAVVSNVQVHEAQIQWDNTPNVTSYNVLFKKSSDTSWNVLSTAVNDIPLADLAENTLYEFQIQSVCALGISPYSAIQTFSTMPAPIIVCTNNYEANNTLKTAVYIPNDTTSRSMIFSSVDNDYYRIEVSEEKRNVRITMTDLPNDYDIYFYNMRGGLIKTSQAGGISNEEIVHNSVYNGPLTYHIRVKGYNGAFSDINCYALQIETSASPFKESNPLPAEDKPTFLIYPIPASDYFTTYVYYEGNKDIVANVYNLFGQKVASKSMVTQNGANEIQFDISHYSAGMYLFELIDSEERRVQKFSIQR